MGELKQPFIGSEALASGVLTRHELRRYYRAIMPNVYLDKRVPASAQRRRLVVVWTPGGGCRTCGVRSARNEVD
jgi:hypothetical protein